MQLLCPECCSEEVGPHPEPGVSRLRCANCGAAFGRQEAHVTVAEAESRLPDPVPEEPFWLDAGRARAELHDADGAIRVVDLFSDADELRGLVDAAQAEDVIRVRQERATVAVYPMSVTEPDPVLAVHRGEGSTLLGFEQKLRRHEDEDRSTSRSWYSRR